MSSAAGVTWDLSTLFSGLDDPRLPELWANLKQSAEEFAHRWKGRINRSDLTAAELHSALVELEKLSNEAAKPGSYASLLFAGDCTNPAYGAFMQEQSEKGSEIRIQLIFFELEVQALTTDHADQLMADPLLANYQHFLQRVRVYAPHQLSEAEESLLEETANVGSRAWVRLHDELLSGHKFPYLAPGSTEVEQLGQEEVLFKLRDKDRTVRQAAADALSNGLESLERTVCFIYNTLLADKKLEDRLRRYEFAEQSRHMANELDRTTVDLVVDMCGETSHLVSRFYDVKKGLLGLDSLTHIDRYAPLFEAGQSTSWSSAQTTVLESFGNFSPAMAERAAEFFDKNWIDAEPRPGKTGGAFCSYVTADLHPYVLMTYQDNLNSVMTLAHELGHGVHGSLSRAQTPFNFHGTLPLAELASIFGEMLVFERIIAEASVKDRVALYAQKIEGIFASVHRQSSMFRFERRCHEARRTTGELSPEMFHQFWQEELQSMFGSSITLGEQHRRWWMYVSHFFFAPFYVYAYSFGELLTLSLYQRAKAEGPAFAEKYLAVLELGGSLSPAELMTKPGVDLKDRAFWEGGFVALAQMVAAFEKNVAEMKG